MTHACSLHRYGVHPLFIIMLLSIFAYAGCSSTQQLSNPTTQATLWVQHAAEFDAITLGTYQNAGEQLSALIEDSSFTAAVEQDGPIRSLPPAVILDVDETVLDNSPYQARLIRENKSYSSESWAKWANEASADAIPGALQFTQKADEQGVTVFYVTNRSASLEEPTKRNLEQLGFPFNGQTDVLLTKGERPKWTSDKTSRRSFLARNYRIIMLVGDNLGDFVDVEDLSEQERNELIQRYKGRWGRSWFMLPNPVYGSWEEAMLNRLPEGQQRRDALKTQ